MRNLLVCALAAAVACNPGAASNGSSGGTGTPGQPPPVANTPDAGSIATTPPPPAEHRVSVVVSGSGTVRSSDGSISCPGVCAADFDDGAAISLSGMPDPGFNSASFAGDCGGTSCELTVSRDEQISATFSRQKFKVTVQIIGSGVVTSTPTGISCPGTCSAEVEWGTRLTMNASPAANYGIFSTATQCANGGSGCTASLDQDVTYAFTFKRMYELTFVSSGDGAGRVTSSPLGVDGTIDCPGTCSAHFFEGTVVELTARPDANSMPASWSGDCESAPCSLVITRDSTAKLVWRARGYQILDVGLPQPGVVSDARAISLDGRWIAGLADTSASLDEIYLWNGTTAVDSGLSGYVLGINGSGSVCGLDLNAHGFIRSSDGALTDMGLGQYLVAINDAGTAVGYGEAGGGIHAFSWPRGQTRPVDLGAVDGRISSAAAINSSGVAVGASTVGLPDTQTIAQHAVRFRLPGLIDDLGTLGGTSSGAAGISDNGIIVGASQLPGDGVSHGFYLEPNGKMIDVGVPEGLKNSRLSGVNSQGTAIGVGDDGTYFFGLVYRGGRLYRLTDLTEQSAMMSASLPVGIAEDGSIAAYGTNAQGLAHGVRLVPEPQ